MEQLKIELNSQKIKVYNNSTIFCEISNGFDLSMVENMSSRLKEYRKILKDNNVKVGNAGYSSFLRNNKNDILKEINTYHSLFLKVYNFWFDLSLNIDKYESVYKMTQSPEYQEMQETTFKITRMLYSNTNLGKIGSINCELNEVKTTILHDMDNLISLSL